VISDLGAVNDRVAGLEAGLHLQMPGGRPADEVVSAVCEGRLAESRLDEVIRDLLALVLKADARRQPARRSILSLEFALDSCSTLPTELPIVEYGSKTYVQGVARQRSPCPHSAASSRGQGPPGN